MATWIALLRGINVGGRNKVQMATLRASLEQRGCTNVATYIQSGNILLDPPDAEAASQAIIDAVVDQCSNAPGVVLLEPQALQDAAGENPFPQGDDAPSSLHYFFAAPGSTLDASKLESAKATTEELAAHGHVVYLWAPEGIARSKVAAKASQLLGAPVTARNHRTVTKLLGMLAQR